MSSLFKFRLTPFFELTRNTGSVSFWPPIPFSALFASNRVVTSSQNGELWVMVTYFFRHCITLLYSLLQCPLSISEWIRKSHIWKKLTSLLLPDFPKRTTLSSYTTLLCLSAHWAKSWESIPICQEISHRNLHKTSSFKWYSRLISYFRGKFKWK